GVFPFAMGKAAAVAMADGAGADAARIPPDLTMGAAVGSGSVPRQRAELGGGAGREPAFVDPGGAGGAARRGALGSGPCAGAARIPLLPFLFLVLGIHR